MVRQRYVLIEARFDSPAGLTIVKSILRFLAYVMCQMLHAIWNMSFCHRRC